MLRDALAATPGVEVRTFSWSRALRGRYDVFHVHWPEILVTGSTRFKTLVRQLLFVLLLLRLRLARIPWVRTEHNLELPSGISRRQRWLLRWADRWTTVRIALNDDTPVPPTASRRSSRTATTGSGTPTGAGPVEPRTYGYVGLIRRYKNVEALLAAFARRPGRRLPAGRRQAVERRDLADELPALAAGRPPGRALARLPRRRRARRPRPSSTLLVLPYSQMHNSGSVLAALSLDTPVLVPANATNAALGAEVGTRWVLQYEGELGADDLVVALAVAGSTGVADAPTCRAVTGRGAGGAPARLPRSGGRPRSSVGVVAQARLPPTMPTPRIAVFSPRAWSGPDGGPYPTTLRPAPATTRAPPSARSRTRPRGAGPRRPPCTDVRLQVLP